MIVVERGMDVRQWAILIHPECGVLHKELQSTQVIAVPHVYGVIVTAVK